MPAMRIWQAFLIAAAPGKVLKMDRPDGQRVLKFDGPSGRGLWIAAFGGYAYEVSVTGFAFLCHRA